MSIETKFNVRQQQIKNTINQYESYITREQLSQISEIEIRQKGQTFLEWINQVIKNKVKKINELSKRSIDIFNAVLKEELEISAKFAQLQQNYLQKSNLIQNNNYTIKSLQTKLKQRENDIYKLTQEIGQLNLKIEKQERKFKSETKIIQQTTQSEKQIFDSIQQEYQYEKQQKDILKDEIQVMKQQNGFLRRQVNQIKRLLKASQNKIQWQIKGKIPLQNTIKQQKTLISKLLHQIQQLKLNTQNQYQHINHHEHFDQKQMDYLSYPTNEQNILSDQISNRQSFCQLDMDEMVRKNSFHKSFIQEPVCGAFQSNHITSSENYDQFVINQSVSRKQSVDNRQNSSPTIDQDYSPARKNTNSSNYNNSILIKDMSESGKISPAKSTDQKKSALIYSPQIHKFQTSDSMEQKQEQLQIHSQKIDLDSTTLSRARKIIPDLYFAHFLLTSQSVKIKEDCQQMLNIDVKPYYKQIIDQRIPMHIWDDWVRNKMKNQIKQKKNRSKNQHVR